MALDITIPTFFKDLYSGLKDSVNYVTTLGGQPYLLERKLKVDKSRFVKTPYWNYYKEIIDKKSPAGYFTKMQSVFHDVGLGKVNHVLYADFIHQGRKAIVLLDNRYMKLEEKRTAFQLTAEKEKALRQLKNAVQQTQEVINRIPAEAAPLSKNRLDFYKEQQANLVDQLFKIPGLQIQTKRDSLTLSGLGAEPVTVIAISVVVVISLLVIAWQIKAIGDSIAFTMQVKKNGDIMLENIKREREADKLLAENKITPEQHAQITRETQANIQQAEEQTSQVLKTQHAATKQNDLYGTIKTVAWIGLAIVGLDWLSKWKQTTIINKPVEA